MSFPETQITFRETAVEKLGVLSLSFRNSGARVIELPLINIRLDENIKILNVSSKFTPDRSEPLLNEVEKEIATAKDQSSLKNSFFSVKNNLVQITLDRLMPYQINKEVFELDIFTEGEIQSVNVLGSGVLKDGLGWAIAFQPEDEAREKQLKIARFLTVIGHIVFLILIVCFGYLSAPKFVSLSLKKSLFELKSDLFFWALIGWFIFFVPFYFYCFLRGLYFYIFIPFTEREIRISMPLRHKKRDRS